MEIIIFALNSRIAPDVVHLEKPADSFDQASAQLPSGLYSTFRTFGSGKKVLGLVAHLNRLFIPAHQQGIEPSISSSEIRPILRSLLASYQPAEMRVRITLSQTQHPGQVIIMIQRLKQPDESIYRNGVEVVSCKVERVNPRLKSTIFIEQSQQERKELVRRGIYEALIVKNGQILEGLTSNFYVIQGNEVITARFGILLGVTRRVVLRVARLSGLSMCYRSVRIDELPKVNEAFITSSSRGVVPVVKVDDCPIGLGEPGRLTVKLHRLYDTYVSQKAEMI